MVNNKFKSGKKSTYGKQMARISRQVLNSQREVKNCSVSATYTDLVAGVRSEVSRLIAQGDGINQRSGDRIEPIRLEVNLSMLAGIASTQSFHRVLIFQDRLNLGTLPTMGEILDAALYDSTYNIRNKQQGRFHVMYDKIHGVVGGSNSAATHIQLKLKTKGHISYNGNTATAADNGPGAIYIFTLTDSVTVSTATIAFYASLFYHDS